MTSPIILSLTNLSSLDVSNLRFHFDPSLHGQIYLGTDGHIYSQNTQYGTWFGWLFRLINYLERAIYEKQFPSESARMHAIVERAYLAFNETITMLRAAQQSTPIEITPWVNDVIKIKEAIKKRWFGNSPRVLAYADSIDTRLRSQGLYIEPSKLDSLGYCPDFLTSYEASDFRETGKIVTTVLNKISHSPDRMVDSIELRSLEKIPQEIQDIISSPGSLSEAVIRNAAQRLCAFEASLSLAQLSAQDIASIRAAIDLAKSAFQNRPNAGLILDNAEKNYLKDLRAPHLPAALPAPSLIPPTSALSTEDEIIQMIQKPDWKEKILETHVKPIQTRLLASPNGSHEQLTYQTQLISIALSLQLAASKQTKEKAATLIELVKKLNFQASKPKELIAF